MNFKMSTWNKGICIYEMGPNEWKWFQMGPNESKRVQIILSVCQDKIEMHQKSQYSADKYAEKIYILRNVFIHLGSMKELRMIIQKY